MTSVYLLEKMDSRKSNGEICAEASHDLVNGKIDWPTFYETSNICSQGQRFSALSKALTTLKKHASHQATVCNKIPSDKSTREILRKTQQAVKVLEIMSDYKSSAEKKMNLCRAVVLGTAEVKVRR